MADEIQQPTGAEPEFLYAFGHKIPRSQLARISLDLEPPMGSTGDQFDDDYWRWSRQRRPKLQGWLAAEELSNRLQRQAYEEYAARQRPAAEEERRERLRELVAMALQSGDPDAWANVDALVGATGQV